MEGAKESLKAKPTSIRPKPPSAAGDGPALGQGQAEIAEAEAPRPGVEQRHAEQQEGGGARRSTMYSDAGLQRMALAIGIQPTRPNMGRVSISIPMKSDAR